MKYKEEITKVISKIEDITSNLVDVKAIKDKLEEIENAKNHELGFIKAVLFLVLVAVSYLFWKIIKGEL